MFTTLCQRLDRIMLLVSRLFLGVALFSLFLLMVIITIDVLPRFFFNKPLLGSVELIENIMVIVVFGAVAYTQVRRGHVTIELSLSRLPRKIQHVIACSVYFLGFCICLLIAWQNVAATLMMSNYGDVTGVLHIPYYPFYFVIALGSALLALVLLSDLLKAIDDMKKRV